MRTMMSILSVRELSQRSIATIIASVVIAASAFIALPAIVSASASSQGGKGDLADTQDCEMQNWPYYARACLKDESRNAGGRALKLRIIGIDRLDHGRTRAADPDKRAGAPNAEAPAGWMMSNREVATYVAAGDFIRRTVR